MMDCKPGPSQRMNHQPRIQPVAPGEDFFSPTTVPQVPPIPPIRSSTESVSQPLLLPSPLHAHPAPSATGSSGDVTVANPPQLLNTMSTENMTSMPVMTMSIPRSQYQCNTLQGCVPTVVATSANSSASHDHSWVSALVDQQWSQEYHDVVQYVLPGEEIKSVEQKTAESAFYSFMDRIRDKYVLVDEVKGVLIDGPGPDPDVKGDMEHLRQWVVAEDEPDRKLPSDAAGERTEEECRGDDEAMWVDQFSAMMESYQQGIRSTYYPFEEDNPYCCKEDPIGEGKALLQLSNFTEAALAFEAACQSNPDHKEAWTLLGRTQAGNERDYLAIAALNHAKDVDPDNVDVYAALAISHTNVENVGLALEAMRMWVTHHSNYQQLSSTTTDHVDTPDEHLFLAYAPVDPKQLQEVLALYAAALELSPADPELHANLGVIHNLSQQFDEAALSFQAAAHLKPADAALWNRLGVSLANGGKNKEALVAYRHALDLNPGYVRVMHNMAVAQSSLSQHEEAARTVVKALTVQKGTANLSSRGLDDSGSLWDMLRTCLVMLHREEWMEKAQEGDVIFFENAFGMHLK